MGRRYNRIVSFTLSVILMAFLVVGCQRTANEVQEYAGFTNYRDIPGITEAEIDAIGRLREQFDYFTYAMPHSTEAFVDDFGYVRGFTALFTMWLTELFDIEFRPYIDEWLDILDGLETGRISFTGELTPTEARRGIFDMTSPIATRPLKQYRLVDSMPVSDIIETRPLLCGFIRATATIGIVTSELPPDTYEIIELDDFTYVIEALRDGTIDAFYYSSVAEINFIEHDDIVSTEFFPLTFMPVSLTTQTPELEPIISVMNKALQHRETRRYISGLYNNGYREYMQYKLFVQLTEQERNFIKERPVIYFAAENDNYPLSFYNALESDWQGIVIDVLREVEALTGLHFERANDENHSFVEMLGLMARGEAAFITDLMYTEFRSGNYLWIDTSLLDARSSLIAKSSHRDVTLNDVLHMNIGLIAGYAHTEFFRKWFANHPSTVEYSTQFDVFEALDRGEIDAVMAGDMSLMILTHYLERPGYRIIYLFDNPFSSAIGFNRNEHLLRSIMNKAIRLIDTEMISENWVRRSYDYQIKITEAQIPWMYGTFITFAVVVMLIAILYVRGSILSKKRAAAEAASRTKSSFLANMSHEIRTPMNSILGFSELALDDDISPKTENYLTNILNNSEGLLQIINDILDISKIESGKMELESVPFSPRELLKACKNIVMPKALEKGLDLRFYAEPVTGKTPLGDPTKLRQVLVNLLSNAVKFTEAGGKVSFYATVIDITENSYSVLAEVKDNGIGMTKEQTKDIFTPFMQAESETTRKYGGTGLGLAITKNLLEMMGSELLVDSTPGEGSTFSFVITFKTIDSTDAELQGTQIVQSRLDKPTFEGEVLLFEDNTMNQQVICEHLARVGLKTVVAENGEIGVNMVKERKENGAKQFDLIFMDMHMPIMDGIEAAEIISELNADIPIVAMTANIMTSDKELYEESGMSGYVGKPFTSQELWRCLLTFFKPLNWQSVDRRQQKIADVELRQNLIDRFVEYNKTKYNEVAEALNDKDVKLAHRLVHTLKSNAAQLGKIELQKISEEMESDLINGKTISSQQMKALETLLTEAVEEFTPQVSEHSSPDDIDWLEDDAARKLLEDLEPMLKDSDPESMSFINELRLIPGSEVLIKHITNFDFELALDSLSGLIDTLNK